MLRLRRGFTLIELIMVIVIIGILAAIAVPRFVNLRAEARRAQCEGSVGAIRAALSNYFAYYSINSAHYNGRFPTTVHELDGYFQDGTLPSEPGWDSGATMDDWDDAYTSGTTGTINQDTACQITQFQ